MAEKSGFFNSDQGDRTYAADFFAEYFASFIGNGVYPNPSTACQVIASGNMTVALSAGQGWINGYYYHNTDNLILNLDIADGVLKRIDRIVLRYTVLNREIKAYVKKGVFASTPVAPALQRDADVWELGVADIFIGNGVVSVSQANITDLRLNNTYCGIVHGVVIQVDTTTIFNQFQAWYSETIDDATTDIATMLSAFQSSFNTWFASIQDVLDENTAGNLLNMINSLIDRMSAAEEDILGLKTFQTAGGTGTAITLTGVELVDGFQTTFVILASNSGAATTINTKSLYKPGTTVVPKLVAGKAATVWYNLAGDCFFIKASAEGTAVAGDVLASKTFSNDDDTGLTGTLVLTGSASITDVKTGKTFYNTDAKTRLTGTNTDKKWASGNGATTNSSGVLTITGLSFTPTNIIIRTNSFSGNINYAEKIYSNISRGSNNNSVLYYFYNDTSFAGENTGAFTITGSGFSTTIKSGLTITCDWIAFG